MLKFKDGYIKAINITLDLVKYDSFKFIGAVLYVPNKFNGEDTYISVVFMGSGKIDNKLNLKLDFLYVSNSEKEAQNDLNSIEKYLTEYITEDNRIKELLSLERMEKELNNSLLIKDIRINKININGVDKFSILGTLYIQDFKDDSYYLVEFIADGQYKNKTAFISVVKLIDNEFSKEYKNSEEEFINRIENYLNENDFITENIENRLEDFDNNFKF